MSDISTVNQVKQHNTSLILNSLKSIPSGTKNDMARMTGLSVATCNTILNELYETNKILLTEGEAAPIGRPPKSFRYNENYSYICCMYFANEGTAARLHYAVTDLRGNFLMENSELYEQIDIHILVHTIEKLKEQYEKIETVSIGLPGYYHNHKLSSSGRLILDGCDIVEELKKHFSMDIYVENDMNAMAYGIYYYRSDIVQKNENITLISFMKQTSLGAGTVIEGKILRGETAFAGEILQLYYPEGEAKKVLSCGDDGIVTIASRLIVTYSVIINPAVIVFTGNNISQDLLNAACMEAQKYISSEHMPRLIYKSNFETYYLQGLSAIALNPLLTPSA